MNILLALAPFFCFFAIADRLVGPTQGLVAGTVVSAALLGRAWMTRGRAPKILEIGTFALFGSMALYALAGGLTESIVGVRLCVDAGLLLIVLASIAIRRPFTLQYAREQVAPEVWNDPAFFRVNMIITWVWALAFAVIVAADLVLLWLPELPRQIGILMIVAALVGAIKFTDWYPKQQKHRALR